MALPPPTDLGPYQATRLLASGGQGYIWLADGPHGEVAVKIPRGEGGTTALKREHELLRAHAGLGLVSVIDADPQGRWMAMERVRGTLVHQWAETATETEILALFSRILANVERLHQAGVVHGDLKPSNLMVDEHGDPRLLDLGVAALFGEKSKEFRGTLGYAAPEVLRGQAPTPRSDLYSLGAVVYRCLTGRDPFESIDPAALAYLPMVTLPIPPSTWRIGLGRRAEHLVLTLLARDPSRRPPSAARAAQALQDIETDEPARFVLGMRPERDALARAVVRASDGEAQVVCLYGPPGSGRRTLIAEAIQNARRLGLASVQVDELDDRFFKDALSGRRPVIVVARGRQRRSVEVAQAFLKTQAAGLVLLHTERPIPSLGERAVHLSPSPLEPADVARLARHMRVDPEIAEQAWERWAGQPGAVIAAMRASLPSHDPSAVDHLPAESKQILAHLQQHGPSPTLELADAFRIDPHTLLDHCAVLIAEGRAVASERGDTISPVAPADETTDHG